ncbi:Flp family type IVb pilin [Vibrio astriarenae]|uniref:Flp family type IVb pilin n=1 Tax=Vibrio astriarenae TaxID=1481923 RepID=UPI00373710D9
MNKMTDSVKAFMRDEEGLSVLEYVIGAGLLAAALITLFTGWGTALQGKLNAALNAS